MISVPITRPSHLEQPDETYMDYGYALHNLVLRKLLLIASKLVVGEDPVKMISSAQAGPQKKKSETDAKLDRPERLKTASSSWVGAASPPSSQWLECLNMMSEVGSDPRLVASLFRPSAATPPVLPLVASHFG